MSELLYPQRLTVAYRPTSKKKRVLLDGGHVEVLVADSNSRFPPPAL
jgi:hypothetical protein